MQPGILCPFLVSRDARPTHNRDRDGLLGSNLTARRCFSTLSGTESLENCVCTVKVPETQKGYDCVRVCLSASPVPRKCDI